MYIPILDRDCDIDCPKLLDSEAVPFKVFLKASVDFSASFIGVAISIVFPVDLTSLKAFSKFLAEEVACANSGVFILFLETAVSIAFLILFNAVSNFATCRSASFASANSRTNF